MSGDTHPTPPPAALTPERDELEACRQMLRDVRADRNGLWQHVVSLQGLLRALHTMVWGECSSLLNEDSGGAAALDLNIRAALAVSYPPRAAALAQIECPACGQVVQQVASATLDLALWQHWNWTCPARRATPPPARAEAPEGAPVCPHCKLPAVLPDVCTPEVNAVLEANIARDSLLHGEGYDLGKRMAEESLRAEIARLTEALEQATRERDGLSKDYGNLLKQSNAYEIERDQQAGALVTLREALEPFARMADAYDPDEGDGLELAWDKRPTIGQLRQARAALAASAPEQEQ